MKKTILFIIVLLTSTWVTSQAQTTANRSRLNMAYQKQSTGLDRSPLVQKPSVIEYKPLALQKPLALTQYYRALLFANPPAASATAVESPVAITNQVDRAERKVTSFDERGRSVEEQLYSSERITVSNIYPNPASEFAELDYTIQNSVRDAKVIFYNVLGSQVAEFGLDKSERKLRVNTREMPTGVYFYQLAVDGKKVATKKMLVRHQQ